MRFQIVHHYQGLGSHYRRGDVLHWCILMVLPHNRESQEASKLLSTLEAGKLYYLSISKKISQLDQVSEAGRSSDLTRADHRGRGALQSCGSCCPVSASFGKKKKEKIRHPPLCHIPAVTSVGYFSVWGMKVEEEVKAKQSVVSQPEALLWGLFFFWIKTSAWKLLFPPSQPREVYLSL